MTLRRFQARGLRQRPCHMVNGQRLVDVLRLGRGIAPLGSVKRRLHQCRDTAEAELPAEESCHRHLVGGVENGRRRAACLQRPAAERERRKPHRDRAPRRSRLPSCARSSAAAGPSIRVGQARQWAIGMRMSGEPSCATTEPSRYSTMPWMIDCGCTSTASCVGLDGEQMMRLDQFEALVHHRCGIDGDLRAHRPVRMLERLLQRCRAHRLARPGAERPAGGGDDDAAHVLARPGGERLKDRVVLGIDRQHARARAAAARMNMAPAQTRHSLLASATVAPRLAAASVGFEPDRAADRGHHPFRRPLGCLDHRGLAARSFDAGAGQRVLQFADRRCRSATAAKRAFRSRASLRELRAVAVRRHRLDPVAAVAALEQIDRAGRRPNRSRPSTVTVRTAAAWS